METKMSETEKKRRNCNHEFISLRTLHDSVCVHCQILFSEDLDSPFKVKEKVIVFDGDEWMHYGDIGDNSQFYKPAIIEKVRRNNEPPHEWLADVLFNYGYRSRGHFQSGIKPIK